jgi:RNA polymerase sigma factor (sigma-70 family)
LGEDGFVNFLQDMGIRPEGTTIDRINPYGDYTPDNSRWASRAQQSKNTRRHYDQNEVNQLFVKHYPDILRNIQSYTPTNKSPEDVLHDVYLRTLDNLNSFHTEEKMLNYLYRAVKNRNQTLFKRIQQERELITELLQSNGHAHVDGYDGLLDDVEKLLTTRQATIMFLNLWDARFTPKVISDILKISARTYSKEVKTIKKVIKKYLSEG